MFEEYRQWLQTYRNDPFISGFLTRSTVADTGASGDLTIEVIEGAIKAIHLNASSRSLKLEKEAHEW